MGTAHGSGRLPRRPTPLPERIGGYRILGEIGRGRWSVFYLAHHDALEQDFTLKVLPAEAAEDRQLVNRLLFEARTLARLNHDAIVVARDVGREDGRYYLALEHVRGPSLAQLLADGPLPPEQVARIGAQVADALHHAHAHDTFHGNVKPGKVLLDEEGKPHLTGFGLVAAHLPRRAPFQLPRGLLVGSPPYMSPEQARSGILGPPTDVWGLGATLYECLTGRRAFAGGTAREILAGVLDGTPAPPRDVVPDVPGLLDAIVLRCLEKDPRDRYPSAADLGRALSAVAGDPGAGPDDTLPL